MFQKKSNIKGFVSFLIVASLSGILFYFFNRKINIKCKEFMDFKALSINGKVVNKYYDSTNHSFPVILIRNFQVSDLIQINLANDTIDLFNKVNINDTIIKIRGDSIIKIIGNGGILQRQLDFGCKK